jgi:type II secretory pathway pseudopilin PulG
MSVSAAFVPRTLNLYPSWFHASDFGLPDGLWAGNDPRPSCVAADFGEPLLDFKRNIHRDTDASGFTLVEVMVAVGLAAIVIVGVLFTVANQWSLIDRGQEQLYVTHILESRLEELRDLTFEELTALETSFSFNVLPATTVYEKSVNSNAVSTDYELPLRDVEGRVAIETLAADLRRVTVEVSWKPDLGSNTLTVTTTSYITRNGINRQ